MSFSERLLAAWYQGHPALALLRPLEALYRRVANGRRADFLSGRKPAYRAPLPVLVVGNITVGGTGKTPMILWMIEHCRARGLRVGVISRGYGARPPTTPWRVRAEQDAAEAGDEPLMIVRRSGVPLMIDPDRPRAPAGAARRRAVGPGPLRRWLAALSPGARSGTGADRCRARSRQWSLPAGRSVARTGGASGKRRRAAFTTAPTRILTAVTHSACSLLR